MDTTKSNEGGLLEGDPANSILVVYLTDRPPLEDYAVLNARHISTNLILIVTASAGGIGPSYAGGTCKDVYVRVANATDDRIKLFDIDHQIEGIGTKSEVVKNTEVPAGRHFTGSLDLLRAGGEYIQFIVQYRTRAGRVLHKWTRLFEE